MVDDPRFHGPPPEVRIDADLVHDLLADQHPDLADLAVSEVDAGWDNTTFRLGDDLAVRLPRRALAAPLIAHEQRWLPDLAPRLPVPIPVPVRVGRPGDGYPWPWSVVPWFPGRPIQDGPLPDPSATAAELGAFVAALHQPAPPDAPPNPYRGLPLRERAELLDRDLARVVDRGDGRVDADRVRGLFAELAAEPDWPGPPLWLHGDLHAANVLVDPDGHLTAVIDFGDLTAGDPACDLAVAWIAFPAPARADLRAAAGADDATWARARGWALCLAVAYQASPLSTPSFLAQGARVLADALTEP